MFAAAAAASSSRRHRRRAPVFPPPPLASDPRDLLVLGFERREDFNQLQVPILVRYYKKNVVCKFKHLL